MAVGTDQAINPPTVLLTGASSQIGVFAIPRLVKAGFQVVAVSRRGRPGGYPELRQVKWLNSSDAQIFSQKCQYLFSAGPLELASKYLATGRQFQTAVVFSSSSVETKQDSENPAEKQQIGDMQKLEADLHLIAQERNLNLWIFRPTLVYGCGLDNNISLLANWIRRFGFLPVNGTAGGLRQPVHADDLASAAVTALLSNEGQPQSLPLAGGETLAYADMVTRIFSALGKPVKLVPLPEWLFVLLINFARLVKTGRKLNGQMVKRQNLDMIFNDQKARELLGFDPRPFKPTAKDFSLPDF